MRRTTITAAAVITGLALPAAAEAKQVTYAGSLADGGKIALDVRLNKDRKPTKITQARGVQLNLDCEKSGTYDDGYATLEGPVKVNRRGRFSAVFVQPDHGNESRLDGKFKRKLVSGTFVFDYHFDAEPDAQPEPLPEEDCTTGEVDYEAERGAKDKTQPEAARAGRW
jgi:hypothetical protein